MDGWMDEWLNGRMTTMPTTATTTFSCDDFFRVTVCRAEYVVHVSTPPPPELDAPGPRHLHSQMRWCQFAPAAVINAAVAAEAKHPNT